MIIEQLLIMMKYILYNININHIYLFIGHLNNVMIDIFLLIGNGGFVRQLVMRMCVCVSVCECESGSESMCVRV